MVAVITGDVINSSSLSPESWLNSIKSVIERNKISQDKWEIFRGDMFQIEIPPIKAMPFVIELKASLKEDKELDVRMSIGFGAKAYTANSVLESNGEAYIYSGQEFDLLKKKTLKIKTPWELFNIRWNMILDLALLTMDNWAPVTASIFKASLQNQNLTQKEIAKELCKSPSSISEGLSRAGNDQIMNMIKQFNYELEIELHSK